MKRFKMIIVMGSIFLLISLGFLLYPTFSNLINEVFNESQITTYQNRVSNLSSEEVEQYLSEAYEYNDKISNSNKQAVDESQLTTEYKDILNIDDGIMGTVEIPKINVKLPIYHGIDDDSLSMGAGHMPDSSFPIGGEGTHSVISAHTAYPGKVFFDDLPDLEVGDVFYIHILYQTYKYEVCEINIVDPDDTSKLEIVEGKDYVSLLTCYPYAVNSHRLIVTGERVADEDVSSELSSNEFNKNVILIVVFTILVLVLILTVIVLLVRKKKSK